MNLFRRDEGQAVVLSVVFMTVLLGMSGLVLDVGSWYRADRAAQATADAAALAAAQALPDDPAEAAALVQEYAAKNGDGSEAVEFTFTGAYTANDTVKVDVAAPASGVFTKLFGVESVTVGATASARAAGPAAAKWVAPIVVNEQHPKLVCTPRPCFGEPTELAYHHLKADGSPDGAGSFGFINLVVGGSNPGTSELGKWITRGFDQYMPLDQYAARTGNPFGSSNVDDSLESRIGTELLFPLYRKLTGTGSNAKYEVVGWVGFHLTGLDLKGNNEKLFGYFTQVVWEGLQATGGSTNSPGVKVIALVD